MPMTALSKIRGLLRPGFPVRTVSRAVYAGITCNLCVFSRTASARNHAEVFAEGGKSVSSFVNWSCALG